MDALSFEAALPPVSQQSTPMRDALLDIQNGLLAGISPGFRVPPRDVVPDAENFVPEPGNPGVEIRIINQAVLFELSLVHRPTYKETSVELRHEQHGEHVQKDDELPKAGNDMALTLEQLRAGIRVEQSDTDDTALDANTSGGDGLG